MTSIKRRLKEFLDYNANNVTRAWAAECIFQNIFKEQCRKAGIENDFYPVGAAASYGLMYLLFRVLYEQPIEEYVELGSGQSTLLADRVNNGRFKHTCYEHDEKWHAHLKGRLHNCDYRLRRLTQDAFAGVRSEWYEDVPPQAFDLMLVDGPGGTERFSRVGCLRLIEQNPKSDFVIIFDDSARPGERETIDLVASRLNGSGRQVRIASLQARARQTVLATRRYQSALCYF